MSYLEIANSPLMWCVCAPLVLLVFALVFIFCKKTLAIAQRCGISKKECIRAFRSGVIASIGPSVAAFIVMLGLMSAVGSPLAWMRLSVIGNANAELLHAGLGASAVGQELGSENYDVLGFASSVWGMSAMGLSWIIVVLFIPKATQLSDRLSRRDGRLLPLVSTSCMIGIMSYMTVDNITASWDKAAAVAAAALIMFLLSKTSEKMPWLREYHLGIAMIFGMIAGALTAKWV